MFGLWIGMLVLCLLAMLFVVWPLRRSFAHADHTNDWGGAAEDREKVNVSLYQSHLDELQTQLDNGTLSPEVFQSLKNELGRGLLEDNQSKSSTRKHWPIAKPLLLLAAAVVPVAGIWLYHQQGAHEDLALHALQLDYNQSARAAMAQGKMPEKAQLETLVERLKVRVAKEPTHVPYQYLLAQNQMNLGDFKGAIQSYQAILSNSPKKQPQVMADLAQAIFFASGNRMIPEVSAFVQRVLEIAPMNGTALSLAGIDAFQKEDYQTAIDYWKKALGAIGPDRGAESIRAGIARAQAALLSQQQSQQQQSQQQSQQQTAQTAVDGSGSEQVDGVSVTSKPSNSATDELAVKVSVSLAPSVKVDPEKAVFIYARAWQGPKMPLAIARLQVKDLPTTVTLSESMSMMAGMTMASFPQLELAARISQDGTPASKSGDWQITQGPIVLKKSDKLSEFSLVIAEQIP